MIMNACAGGADESKCEERVVAVKAALAAAGIEAEIFACKGVELVETARKAATSGVDAVIAAGGDGTVSAVASALAGTAMPMAVLPLGTLNHFARDIGMPLELEAAARAIASGKPERIDLGEVNGRTFINNSSIGLYPKMVISRDAEQKRSGAGKWWAMIKAAWRVLLRFPLMLVRVITQHSAVVSRTPFLFVGNNDYALTPLTLGQREHLNQGKLSLYMVRCTGRVRMFWLMMRAMLQRLEEVEDFEVQAVTELRVDLRRRRIKVAVDGEVASMSSPLKYRILPGALSVLITRVPAA